MSIAYKCSRCGLPTQDIGGSPYRCKSPFCVAIRWRDVQEKRLGRKREKVRVRELRIGCN